MSNLKITALTLLMAAVVMTVVHGTAALWQKQQPQIIVAPQQPEPSLTEFVQKTIETYSPKSSTTAKFMKTKMLVGIANDVFSVHEHKLYWITTLSKESSFNGKAVSPVGARGIGQLMPQFKDDFAKSCGLTGINVEDLSDDYTNAHLSACEFKRLIELSDGFIPMALIKYNSGAHSHSVKQAKAGHAPVPETSAYVTTIMVRKHQMEQP